MTQGASASTSLGRIALLVAALVAAFAIGLGIMRTRPQGLPVASGSQPSSLEDLARTAAARPNDVTGWRRLGAAYFDAERYADAAHAYERASALSPRTSAIWSALGEARVMASRTDPMPAAAADAFARALALDPKDPRARYFQAVRRDLAGEHAGAIEDWLALLADTPADAPWRANLVRTIEQVGKINKIDVAPRLAAAQAKAPQPAMPAAARAIPGPSAQDLAAAGAIPPGEQRAMAEGMVARLEARLGNAPADTDGWIMLMRSRVTLGQRDKAAQALRDAIAANPGQADVLREQAQVLGIR